MSFRRTPGANRNNPSTARTAAKAKTSTPTETDFAWKCHECLRIVDIRFYSQDDPDSPHAPAPSTAGGAATFPGPPWTDAVLRRDAIEPSRPTLITLSHGRATRAVVSAREITAAMQPRTGRGCARRPP